MKLTYKNLPTEREALIRVYRESRDKNLTPAATADLLIRKIGRDGAAEIIAAMIVSHGTWDQRISGSNRTWAASTVLHTGEELRQAGVYYCDAIHPAHIDQLAAALRRKLQAA